MESRVERTSCGGSPGLHHCIPEAARQTVLDAAALLQVRRSEAAAEAASGGLADIEIVARGKDVGRWMRESSSEWREVFSVRPTATAAEMRASLPNNRAQLERGLRMVSVFDAGVDLDARMLLANEPVGTYLLGCAPVQMKIVDRRLVLLQGPFLDDEQTVMAASSGPCLEAAWRYWEATISTSSPVGDGLQTLRQLTPRQRQVVALMSTGLADDAIAASLGVSVRTVRSDVAALLDVLGVRSRFAAGIRLRLWSIPQH